MKRILFAAGITIIGLSAAFAQDVKQATPVATQQSGSSAPTPRSAAGPQKMTPEFMAQKRTERIDRELTLNEDQKKKVYELFLKEGKENQGRSIQREETDAQLKTILNEEQNKKYEEMKTQRKAMMQQRKQQSTRSSELKSAPSVK